MRDPIVNTFRDNFNLFLGGEKVVYCCLTFTVITLYYIF